MEEPEEGELQKRKSEIKDKIKKHSQNYWMVSTFILAIILAFFLVSGAITGNTITGGVIGEEDAGQKIVDFALSRGADVNLVEVNDAGSLYEVVLLVQSEEVPVYITKDGEYFISQPIPLEQPVQIPQKTEVQKTDKPTAELFIWSYCPYGVTALSPFAEVAKLLSSQADFKVVLYHDGHGPFETQQNKIQACIQKYEPEKYWDYAEKYVTDIYPKCGSSRDVECDKEESTKLMKSLNINSEKIFSCVESEGGSLVAQDRTRAGEAGVSGSPSLVINNVLVNVARNAEAYKQAVCSAFNQAPEECTESLSSDQATTTGAC